MGRMVSTEMGSERGSVHLIFFFVFCFFSSLHIYMSPCQAFLTSACLAEPGFVYVCEEDGKCKRWPIS